MNKRIAKKHGAGRSYYQTIDMPDGPTLVHINRRGCKGPWTAKDQEALAAIVTAARRMIMERKSEKTP